MFVGNIEIEWKCADCSTPDEPEPEEEQGGGLWMAGRGQLDLYLLIQLLGEEAALVTKQLDLLRMSVVTRCQRNQRTTGRLFRLWDQLQNEERTPRQLLRAASHLIPVPAEQEAQIFLKCK